MPFPTGGLRQECDRLERAHQQGQPGGQRHAQQEMAEMIEVGDLPLFPMPAGGFEIPESRLNGETPPVAGDQAPVGGQVGDQTQGRAVARSQYTTTLAGRQPAFLNTQPASLWRSPRRWTNCASGCSCPQTSQHRV